MCRSIKTLRPPYTEDATSEDSRAAALQYVRKVAGMRSPSKANHEAFDAAVAQIAAVTDELLASLVLPARSARATVASSEAAAHLTAVDSALPVGSVAAADSR